MNKLGTGARASTSITYGGFASSLSGQTYTISTSAWSGSSSLGYQALVTPSGYRWGMNNVSITSYSLTNRSGTSLSCTITFRQQLIGAPQFMVILASGVSKPTSACTLTISYSFTDIGTKTTTTNRNYYWTMIDKTYTGSWVGIPFNPVTPLLATSQCDAELDSEVLDGASRQESFWVTVTNPN